MWLKASSHGLCSYSEGFGLGAIFTQNCIMKVGKSFPYLKSTSKSWALKQKKIVPPVYQTRNKK